MEILSSLSTEALVKTIKSLVVLYEIPEESIIEIVKKSTIEKFLIKKNVKKEKLFTMDK
jgi:hypothetical protein